MYISGTAALYSKMYSFGMTWVIWSRRYICEYKLFGSLFKLLASLMRNYFPKRQSRALLHTLSKLYDVPVGFVSPLFSRCVLLYLRSPKGGCCSISDDLSCSPGLTSGLQGFVNVHRGALLLVPQ